MSKLEALRDRLEELETERDELLARDRETWISLGEPPGKPKASTTEEQARLEELQNELIPDLKE